MNALWSLSKRVVTLFFRDKSSIFFSVLSSALMLLVFLVFLTQAYNDPEMSDSLPGFALIFQQWLMAGILYTTTFSSALNAMQQYPVDHSLKVSHDLMVTPIKRSTVVGSYILGSTITAFLMSSIIFVLTIVNILVRSGKWPGVMDVVLVLLAIIISSIFHTAFAFFLATFTRTARSYSSLGIVFHSISGFLAAAYIPIGELAEPVRKIFAFSPFIHASSLLRKAYTFGSLGGVDGPVAKGFRIFTGIDVLVGEVEVQVWQSVLFLLGLSALLFLLSVRRISKSRERL